ncbi:TPA: UvaF [Enterococcus faecalis]|nr:UvaF [Enterococcus faecalis]
MKQNRNEFFSYFSRSIKQNKPLYLMLLSSEINPAPSPVIGTFRGYVEENKIIIGEDTYNIEEIERVCMYRHSSRIKQEERANSNPFQGLVSPTLSKKEQKKLDEYFSDWGFRNEGI